jgi:poly(3-hydroxybutyrate) depolymerase
VIALVAGTAHAKPSAPCTKCVLEVPAGDGDKPMLVVLHGDREHARDAAARWRAATKANGWVLLALEVPEGDSWWQWEAKDPTWVIARADKVIADAHVDRSRVYLAGWSGGATFIGAHVQAWEGTFAALVIHGGGRGPDDAACVKHLPTFFLVGDRNPLHELAVRLKKYFEHCKQEVVWDLVEKGAHEAERKALTKKKAAEILHWLLAHEKP